MSTTTEYFGRVLQGRYRLEAGLGTGGFAHVFLAYDLNLERRVAVKLLHSGLANDEQFFNRFRGEARAAAMLNHPNIVQVYDWGVDLGEPFLVLEYLAGGSLRNILDNTGSLGAAEVGQIGAQTARGLSYAHGLGLIHRDIKPANLLFDEHGVVHIADFGLARALADAAWTEPMGLVFGTARYASPEQAKGENVDQRSDIYSLALVCFEALVGNAPFQGDTPLATLMARVHGTLPYSPKLEPFASTLMNATRGEISERLDGMSFANEFELFSQDLPQAEIPIATQSPIEFHRLVDQDLTTNQASDTEVIGLRTDATTPKKHHRRKSPRSQRDRMVRWAGLVGIVALLISGGAVSYVHYGVYGHVVPKLIGSSISNAEASAKRATVRIGTVRREFSSTTSAGTVLGQTLSPGTHVRSDTVINLVVSQGHAPIAVPIVTGKTKSKAIVELSSKHFKTSVSDAYNETVASGSVISTSPSSGHAPFGSTVAVVVSSGPQPRTIPNVVGQTYAQAKQSLVALRLSAKQTRQYSNDVARGVVISTNPASGSSGIPVGTVIDVTVSAGPHFVTVPMVAGESIDDAVATLQAAGLVVAQQVGPPFATNATATNPNAGTQVVVGSEVTLFAA